MVHLHGEVGDIERSLNSHLNTELRRFVHRYRDQLALPIEIDPGDGMFKSLFKSINGGAAGWGLERVLD